MYAPISTIQSGRLPEINLQQREARIAALSESGREKAQKIIDNSAAAELVCSPDEMNAVISAWAEHKVDRSFVGNSTWVVFVLESDTAAA
jgi:hypothetical protein